MSLLQLGFREIGRKFQRLSLGRRIKAAGKERTDALRALGRRAAEAGVTGAASEGLKAGLAETEAKDRQLASRLNALDDQKKALEAQRDADSARFDALEKEVMARKSPVDAELAAQQKTATRHQRDSEDVRRRLNQANQERHSLEQALQQPASQSGPAADRPQAEARIAALLAAQRDLETRLAQLAEAGTVTQAGIESLQDTLAPMQTELDRIKAEHKQAAESLKQALADQRKEADQIRAEITGLSRQREKHFEELGGALAAAGIDAPALAAERQSVAAAEQSQAALQSQYDALLEESGDMPKRTMVKFSALMAIAVFAMAGATYAASQALQALNRPPPVAEDCSRMTYDTERPPVQADPGGPYTVTRGQQAKLDGSKSRGSCLRYTWTFSAAPKDAADKPGHSDKGSAQDQDIFRAVDRLACPEGTAGNPGASKTGPRAPTHFLCSLTVTLTVTDGRSTDSKDVLVKVKPRGPKGWKTSIDTGQKETFIKGSRLVIGELRFGKNVCALDTTGGHALHAGKSWQGEGYSLSSIADPDGPFDGWWYIGGSSLKIKRSVQINQDLGKKSELYRHNLASGNQDIEILRKSVLEHERLHGILIFEKMQKIQKEGNDPAKIIETLSAREADKEVLIEWTDVAIAQIEGDIYPPQGSEEYIKNHAEIKSRMSGNSQFNRGGEVLIPDTDGNYKPYTISNFATAGDSSE
jgi:hypothetical protein